MVTINFNIPAMKPDLQQIQRRLSAIREGLFSRYPITSLGIFGSVVRGEADAESDVDILVEFSSPVGFEIVDLVLELEESLGCHVDLVSRKGVRDRLWKVIEEEIVYV